MPIADFSGDTNGFGTELLGLYPDGNTFRRIGLASPPSTTSTTT